MAEIPLATGDREDHRGVMVKAVLPTVEGQPNYRRNVSIGNRKALRDQSVREALAQEWQETPNLPDGLDLDDQEQLLSKWSRMLYAKHAPPTRRGPRKDWISQETWETIEAIRESRTQMFETFQALRIVRTIIAWMVM